MISGLDGPPREIAVGGGSFGDRRLDTGDEALETQDAVQLLRADADRCPAPAPQLTSGDRQQRGQNGCSAPAPRHEVADGFAHQRVRLACRLRDERLEPVERDPRRSGGPQQVGQAAHVTPEVSGRDVLIDQLVGGHAGKSAEHTRAQPHPHDRRPCWDLLIRRRRERTEQPRRRTEHIEHLGATVRHVPLRQGLLADLLDPDRHSARGQRRGRTRST